MSNRGKLSNFWQRLNQALLVEKRWIRKSIKAFWVLFLFLILGFPLYVWAVIENPYNLFGPMPSLREIENPENDLSSEVISADGVSLGRYIRYHRSQVSFDDLSPVLVNTLVISEDVRFYEHSGIDLRAFGRVLFGFITFRKQGGGSTLTQQTAKNLFRTRADELQGKVSKLGLPFELLISKTKEWIIAYRLEQYFTKNEILALYLNTVPFNNGAYGIKVAAETYFNKSPSDLNMQESALLVGMLQGTSLYNPIRHPERALRKRNEVLNKLFTYGYVADKAVIDSVKAFPLQLDFKVQDQNEGLAPYFRSMLQNFVESWAQENGYNIYESGLKIYTTIDSRMQRFAEEAMAEHMTNLQKSFEQGWGNRNPWVDDSNMEIADFLKRKIKRSETYQNLVKKYGADDDSVEAMLNEKKSMTVFSWRGDRDTIFSSYDSMRYYNRFLKTGVFSMDPRTGAVRAWVGGLDHKYFQYDHVRQATRQPGSTFKAFLYGKAMEDGYSPCHELYDLSPSIEINGKIYHPKNANGTYGDGQLYTLRQSMAKSLNSISVQMIDKLQPKNVAEFATRLGITTKLDPVHALALGTSDVSLYDMVAAYSTFVNSGVHTKPFFIGRIEDKHGNVVATFTPQTKQALDEATAYKIVHLLKGGLEEEGGSSRALSDYVKIDNEIGGKTGTTDNGSDGWYMGVTHNLVTGVWVGGDERSIHFPRWGEGSGGKAALPIWDKYMTKVYLHPETGYLKGTFLQPSAMDITFQCDRHQKDSLSTDIGRKDVTDF